MVKRGILKGYQIPHTFSTNHRSRLQWHNSWLHNSTSRDWARYPWSVIFTITWQLWNLFVNVRVDCESVWRNHVYTKRTNHWNKVNKPRNFTHRHNNLERVLVNPHGRLVFLHHRVSSQDIHTRCNLKTKYVQFVQIKTDFTRHTGVIITPRRVFVREQYAGRLNTIINYS